MVKSGLTYSYGIGFWGPNGHDGIWHMSLINSLAQGTWRMPVFSGEEIKNYHIGFDLIIAFIRKISFIPSSVLYFQIIPPITAFLVGVFCFLFVYEWKRSKVAAFWSSFFVYFGGSFGWVVSIFRDRSIDGESMFWSQQSISTLINPPYALSLVLLFAGLYILLLGIRKDKKTLLTACTFIFGILIQIKVYAGLLAMAGLLVMGLYNLITRKGTQVIKVFAGSLIISILLFSSLNKSLGDTLVFQPFWFLETMMGTPDRLGWPKFYSAMYNYKVGGVFLKGLVAYAGAFGIFVLGNFGTRLLFLLPFRFSLKRIKDINSITLFSLVVISSGVLIPTFFIQSGTSWNTIQFLYYSLVFSGVLAGTTVASLVEKGKKWQGFAMGLAIVVLTLPTTLGTLKHYLPLRPPAKISNEELSALKFLKNMPAGVVLTYPYKRSFTAGFVESDLPRPLYLYESTAYVSAYSGKPVFLEDEVNLNITGYDWKTRRDEVEALLDSKDSVFASNFLKGRGIKYIYFIKGQTASLTFGELGLHPVFENPKVQIFEVN
jgi:hypothetical protein